MRLQKYISRAGYCSRRHAEELIVNGKVAVNGQIVTQLGTKVDPEKDKVTVEGSPVSPEENLVYI
ncbi:MAG: S4 domain-containing protein, partial [Desulfobacterales bacterium]|nr:S4 domain-containing protein [Desulfobacterales bacterium]